MPYDGSGNFTIINNFEEDRINGVSIDSLKMDNNFDDIANGLSNAMLRSGSAVMAGILNMGDHKITNLVAGTSSKDAVNKGQMDTALSAKQATIIGGASTITSSNLTASRALVSSSSGKVAVSAVTATELGYLDGVTSAVQTQINAKAADNAVVHKTGDETITGRKTFTDRVYTNAEVVYIDNVTKGTAPSSVQYGNIYMVDSTKSWGDLYALGRFVTAVNSDKSVVSQIQAYKNEANSNIFGYIRVTYDTANNQYFASIGGSASGTNWSLTRETNSTGINTIPTMGWVNNPATSTNVVHRSGNETIGGTKTFTSGVSIASYNPNLVLRENDVVKGTNPQTEQAWGIYAKDSSNGAEVPSLGSFVTHLLTNGTVWSGFSAYKNTSGSTDRASIRVYYPQTGSAYTYAPTPSLSSSDNGYSNQIATVGYLNGSNSGVVHIAGDETITGEKTFTKGVTVHKSDPRVWLENDDAIKGTAPSSNLVSAFQFRDKNHELLGSVHSQYQTDKKIITQLLAYKANSASDTASVRMGVGYNYKGKEITFAPACDDYDSIVTTIGNSKAENGFFKLGNGLIIQWGHCGGSGTTVTLPTAFTTTNYSLAFVQTTTASVHPNTSISNKTTTSFKVNVAATSQNDWIAIGY